MPPAAEFIYLSFLESGALPLATELDSIAPKARRRVSAKGAPKAWFPPSPQAAIAPKPLAAAGGCSEKPRLPRADGRARQRRRWPRALQVLRTAGGTAPPGKGA